MLNRSKRIYFRRFRTDRTHFERSQKRTHPGEGFYMSTTHRCALEAHT